MLPKSSRTRLQFIIFSITCCIACSNPEKMPLSIGPSGNTGLIIVPDNNDEIISMAASELQRYLKAITGKELAIQKNTSDSKDEKQIRFRLLNDPDIKWDGFRINVNPDSIVLTARESRGLLFAAYNLLEKSGCSFFYPGEKEQIIPKKQSLTFKTGNWLFNPLLEHRGLAPYGLQASSTTAGRDFIDWMAKNKFNYILVSENRPSDSDGPANGSIWKEVTTELLPELQKRGFIIEMSEHCTSVFFPRTLFKDHPDWFALNDGKRRLGELPYSGQMCYSNKDAIEYYGNALANYAAKHPEFHVIGTWPLDGGRYCECENCKDPETYFRASMRVAEKIRAVRPDLVVEYLAYQGQYSAPSMKEIPSNMSVLWCPDPGQKSDTLKQWIEKTKNAEGVEEFEYLLGDNYRARCNVWLKPGFAASIPNQVRQSGFRGSISLFLPIQNWWRAAFNNSFFAKACWEQTLNLDSTLMNYCKSYYPENADKVYSVFQMIFNDFQKGPYRVPEPLNTGPVDGMTIAAGKILQSLDSLISNTQDNASGIQLKRIKSYVDFSLLTQLAFSTGKKSDLKKVVDYSTTHPDQEMVIMYPGYINWRNEEYFK